MSKKLTPQDRRRLTPRQLQILSMIRDYQRSRGCSPTMQEIADRLDITKVTVFEHVETLIAKGLLRRLPHKARSLELTGRVELPDDNPTHLPIAGYIAAGRPIDASETHDHLDLLSLFSSRHGAYVLKVRGESMIGDQIRDGDYVICENRQDAHNGETIVALLESGEVTLKKYFKENNRIRLQPANPAFEPIFVDQVRIQGVVRGVIRAY